MFKNNKKKAFTLIELLVVVAIISLLSSIVMASLNSARVKARDAKRKADLHQLRSALELSFNNRGYYPGDGNCDLAYPNTDQSTCWNNPAAGTTSYILQYLVTADKVIPSLPVDPINNSVYYYFYEPNSANQPSCTGTDWTRACEFTLGARLEGGGVWYDDSFGTGVR